MSRQEHHNWLSAKRRGREFFEENTWGVLEWEELPYEAMRYTAGDTNCLFGLLQVYAEKMLAVASALQLDSANTLMQMVEEASQVRIIESISDSFDTDDTDRQAKRYLPRPICDLEEVWPGGGEDGESLMVRTEEWLANIQEETEARQRVIATLQLEKERKEHREQSAKLHKYKMKKKRLRRRGSTLRNWVTNSAFPRRARKGKKVDAATLGWRYVSNQKDETAYLQIGSWIPYTTWLKYPNTMMI